MTTSRVQAFSARNSIRTLPQGGMLVVCGPPLGGKGPLAARIEELLPYAAKLESVDNLTYERQTYPATIGQKKVTGEVETALLRDAARVWQKPAAIPPLLVICARFATPSLRRTASQFASDKDMRFLLVEATSAPIRSLRRISNLMLSPQETLTRIERYERARDKYQPTTATERTTLPAMTFKSVLSNLDDVADNIVTAWCSI